MDHLYAFFLQWSPDIYGEETEDSGEARRKGFVVIEDDEVEETIDVSGKDINKHLFLV